MNNASQPTQLRKGPFQPTLILHGGAGSITRANLPPALYAEYHSSLLTYLTSTHDLLQAGSNAVDAACHAVSRMEDDELFNCGRGSVFTEAGQVEMEASLMVSSVLPEEQALKILPGYVKRSAAVSLIRQTRHPILLAKELLMMADDGNDQETSKNSSNNTYSSFPTLSMIDAQAENREDNFANPNSKGNMHGHLSGSWVEEWGFQSRGLERKPKSWFWTRRRWEEHRRGLKKPTSQSQWREELRVQRDREECLVNNTQNGNNMDRARESFNQSRCADCIRQLPSQGTVGAVCMDSWGNICVATSTGGLTNKRPGRIGDTPTVGAGFWAESWDDTSGVLDPSRILRPHSVLGLQSRHRQSCFLPKRVFERIDHAVTFLVGDCLPSALELLQAGSSRPRNSQPSDSFISFAQPCTRVLEEQPSCTDIMRYSGRTDTKTVCLQTGQQPYSVPNSQCSQAIAISGTGNGDSFLRLVAARTASSIARYSPASLQHSVSRVAGPGGELQRSAGNRWGETGEGEGGMIGIEATFRTGSRSDLKSMTAVDEPEGELQADVVFDFNCGGMWRAYYVSDEGTGQLRPKIMVFKEEY